ncbi:MAG: esterase/lipase family protein [Akkermansiaceae bacterium]
MIYRIAIVMKNLSLFVLLMSILTGSVVGKSVVGKEGVILLHGLCRSSSSMEKMARELRRSGFVVENVAYASRSAKIRELAEVAIGSALQSESIRSCSKVHFVTHSLGGILVRSYLDEKEIKRLGRVVMLSPPNQGSEVVDKLGSWKVFRAINGPAGGELGTGVNSVPNQLGRINFECGVITGDRSINWINSLMIPGKDDGKVSVVRSNTLGVKEHRVMHVTHPYIMKNKKVILEVVHFLVNGEFIVVE